MDIIASCIKSCVALHCAKRERAGLHDKTETNTTEPPTGKRHLEATKFAFWSFCLDSDLLWFQVKQAALSFLHLIHCPIHAEGDTFVFSLAHDKANIPAVKQSTAAGSPQVHYDSKIRRTSPRHPEINKYLHLSLQTFFFFLAVNICSLIGIGKTVPFDLYSSKDASVSG